VLGVRAGGARPDRVSVRSGGTWGSDPVAIVAPGAISRAVRAAEAAVRPPEPLSWRGARSCAGRAFFFWGAPLPGGGRAAGASLRIATRLVHGSRSGGGRFTSEVQRLVSPRWSPAQVDRMHVLSRRSEAEPQAGAGQGKVG
jgi:hypothetical protein